MAATTYFVETCAPAAHLPRLPAERRPRLAEINAQRADAQHTPVRENGMARYRLSRACGICERVELWGEYEFFCQLCLNRQSGFQAVMQAGEAQYAAQELSATGNTSAAHLRADEAPAPPSVAQRPFTDLPRLGEAPFGVLDASAAMTNAGLPDAARGTVEYPAPIADAFVGPFDLSAAGTEARPQYVTMEMIEGRRIGRGTQMPNLVPFQDQPQSDVVVGNLCPVGRLPVQPVAPAVAPPQAAQAGPSRKKQERARQPRSQQRDGSNKSVRDRKNKYQQPLQQLARQITALVKANAGQMYKEPGIANSRPIILRFAESSGLECVWESDRPHFKLAPGSQSIPRDQVDAYIRHGHQAFRNAANSQELLTALPDAWVKG